MTDAHTHLPIKYKGEKQETNKKRELGIHELSWSAINSIGDCVFHKSNFKIWNSKLQICTLNGCNIHAPRNQISNDSNVFLIMNQGVNAFSIL